MDNKKSNSIRKELNTEANEKIDSGDINNGTIVTADWRDAEGLLSEIQKP